MSVDILTFYTRRISDTSRYIQFAALMTDCRLRCHHQIEPLSQNVTESCQASAGQHSCSMSQNIEYSFIGIPNISQYFPNISRIFPEYFPNISGYFPLFPEYFPNISQWKSRNQTIRLPASTSDGPSDGPSGFSGGSFRVALPNSATLVQAFLACQHL